MRSLWEKEVAFNAFPKSEGDKKTDVLIVGGGMAGILCAHFLQKYGVEYCLVEAGKVAEGVTGHTTAKITSQHGLLYHEIADRYGLEAAARYYSANQEALDYYRMLCERISCDFEEKDNFVYSVQKRMKLERELSTLEKIHADAGFKDNLPLPFGTCGAVCFPRQAQFHPLKFLAEITKNLNIYEHTKVIGFGACLGKTGGRKVLLSGGGTILAKKIVIATHFPMLNKHGAYFMKLYQHRSYVSALKGAPQLPGMYVDEDKKGFSFRNAGDCLLLGGGSHRTGKQGGSYTEVRGAAERFYPGAKEVCRWAAQDCMSPDGIPYIGKYSKGSHNIYVATGFNKWGMTSAMTAGMLLADLVLEKRSEYKTLFSPSRPALTLQVAVNVGESLLGVLSFSKKRCPHLGCALKWNKEEHSWDCPCHGSRFGENGVLLNNPANDNLKKSVGKK